MGQKLQNKHDNLEPQKFDVLNLKIKFLQN